MKTAIFMSFVATNAQVYYAPEAPKDVAAAPVEGPNGKYGPADPVAPAPKPVDPVEEKDYEAPAPVDPAPVMPTPVYEPGPAPVDPKPVAPEPYEPDHPAPTETPIYDDPQVPDEDVDDEDDKPAPVYDAPSQHKCGTLYVDVLEHWFRYILSQIDPTIVEKIIAMLKELFEMLSNVDGNKLDPAAYAPVVAKVHELAGYCAEHLVDDDVKKYVAEACTKAQNTYSNIYDTEVDPTVYQAWDELWKPCHNGNTTTPDPAYSEPVDEYYKAYSGYMENGGEDPAYQQHIQKLCDSEDPTVAEPAQKVKYSVQELNEASDGTSKKEAAAGKLVGSVLSMLSAAILAF